MSQSVFPDKIRELRREAHYTQAQVSKKLNIQRQTYCNYENASRTPPLEIIIALAELYDVTLDYLVRGIVPDEAAVTVDPLNPMEKKLLDEFSSLTINSQKEVHNFILFKKQYPS